MVELDEKQHSPSVFGYRRSRSTTPTISGQQDAKDERMRYEQQWNHERRNEICRALQPRRISETGSVALNKGVEKVECADDVERPGEGDSDSVARCGQREQRENGSRKIAIGSGSGKRRRQIRRAEPRHEK